MGNIEALNYLFKKGYSIGDDIGLICIMSSILNGDLEILKWIIYHFDIKQRTINNHLKKRFADHNINIHMMATASDLTIWKLKTIMHLNYELLSPYNYHIYQWLNDNGYEVNQEELISIALDTQSATFLKWAKNNFYINDNISIKIKEHSRSNKERCKKYSRGIPLGLRYGNVEEFQKEFGFIPEDEDPNWIYSTWNLSSDEIISRYSPFKQYIIKKCFTTDTHFQISLESLQWLDKNLPQLVPKFFIERFFYDTLMSSIFNASFNSTIFEHSIPRKANQILDWFINHKNYKLSSFNMDIASNNGDFELIKLSYINTGTVGSDHVMVKAIEYNNQSFIQWATKNNIYKLTNPILIDKYKQS